MRLKPSPVPHGPLLLGLEDASAIRDLTREAYAKWVPLVGREPMPMVANYDEAVKHHRFDPLYVGGVLAALIENIAVRPRFQGRGRASKLMKLAETIACSLGRTRPPPPQTRLIRLTDAASASAAAS